MIDNKNKSVQHSKAGKIGAASRWKNHVKIQTILIRVNKNDADFFTSLASRSGLSVAVLVHRFVQSLCADQVADISS